MLAAQDVQVALVGMVGTVIVALIGLGAVMLNQNRSHGAKLAKIEHGINHVDEEPTPDGAPITLGQLVKSIDGKAGVLLREIRGDLDAVGRRIDTKLSELPCTDPAVTRIERLVQAAEGRRVEADIPEGERTEHEQAGVDALHAGDEPGTTTP